MRCNLLLGAQSREKLSYYEDSGVASYVLR